MVNHLYVRIAKLRRVILAAKLARIEQDSQNLWVRPCRPLRHHKQARKNQNSAEKTAEEVERRRTHHQGDEEQLSFSAKNRERLVDRLMSRVDPAFSPIGIPPRRLPRRLNVAAPIIKATKNSCRSAPRIVSGLLIAL